MNIKKIFIVLMTLGLFLVFVTPLNAVPAWYRVKVIEAGNADDGSLYLRLTEIYGNFEKTWCVSAAGQEKTFLAIALTSMTNDMPVRVYVDAEQSLIRNRVIYNMYLMVQ